MISICKKRDLSSCLSIVGISPAVVDNAYDIACSLTDFSECTKENAFTFRKVDEVWEDGAHSLCFSSRSIQRSCKI